MQENVNIQNVSSQDFEVILKSGKLGYMHKWLRAGETIIVPKNSLTDLVLELKRRNILEIN